MAWVTIDRETIKAELARHYGNANRCTVEAWEAANGEQRKAAYSRCQKMLGRIFGVEALILRANGITVSTEYRVEPQYRETMCPRISAILINWNDGEPAERVEIHCQQLKKIQPTSSRRK